MGDFGLFALVCLITKSETHKFSLHNGSPPIRHKLRTTLFAVKAFSNSITACVSNSLPQLKSQVSGL